MLFLCRDTSVGLWVDEKSMRQQHESKQFFLKYCNNKKIALSRLWKIIIDPSQTMVLLLFSIGWIHSRENCALISLSWPSFWVAVAARWRRLLTIEATVRPRSDKRRVKHWHFVPCQGAILRRFVACFRRTSAYLRDWQILISKRW